MNLPKSHPLAMFKVVHHDGLFLQGQVHLLSTLESQPFSSGLVVQEIPLSQAGWQWSQGETFWLNPAVEGGPQNNLNPSTWEAGALPCSPGVESIVRDLDPSTSGPRFRKKDPNPAGLCSHLNTPQSPPPQLLHHPVWFCLPCCKTPGRGHCGHTS